MSFGNKLVLPPAALVTDRASLIYGPLIGILVRWREVFGCSVKRHLLLWMSNGIKESEKFVDRVGPLFCLSKK